MPIPLVIAVFDLRSVFHVQAVCCLSISIYMLFTLMTTSTCKGYLDWALAGFGFGFFSLMISLRGVIPDAVSILGANVSLIYSMLALVRGMHGFYGLPWPRAWALLPIAVMIGVIYLTFVSPSFQGRVLVLGLGILLLTLRGLLFWKTVRADSGRPIALWLALMYGLTFLTFLAHVSAVCFLKPDYSRMATNIVTDWMFSLLYPLSVFGLFLGLIAAHAQRLESTLQKALQQVRTLQGIIPVCCSCKKIMNKQGSWDQMEIYISQNTDAQFSHDYCPDCASRVMQSLSRSEARGPS